MSHKPKTVVPTEDPALLAQFEAFANDPHTQDMHSPTGLSARGRKAWHLLAAHFGLSSASVGEGLHRVVRVSKATIEKRGSALNTTGMRRFREDFGIKINLADANDFDYFVDLYEPDYKARTRLDMMLGAMAELGDEAAWKAYQETPKQKIWSAIKATEAWAAFDADDASRFALETESALTGLDAVRGDPFTRANDGRFFVSFDLKSANFNSLRFFDPALALGCTSWGGLLDRFIDLESRYFHHSKLFRQKVFWQLHPTRLMAIAGALISRVLRGLVDAGAVTGKVYWNTDEVVLALPERVASPDGALEAAREMWAGLECHEGASAVLDSVSMEAYRLRALSSSKPMFVKERIGEQGFEALPAFIKVNPGVFAIIYKHCVGLALDPRDLKASWDAARGDFAPIDVAALGLRPEVRRAS